MGLTYKEHKVSPNNDTVMPVKHISGAVYANQLQKMKTFWKEQTSENGAASSLHHFRTGLHSDEIPTIRKPEKDFDAAVQFQIVLCHVPGISDKICHTETAHKLNFIENGFNPETSLEHSHFQTGLKTLTELE